MALFGSKPSDDTPERRSRLTLLCETVTSGLRDFVTVGDALAEIRDGDLYKLEAPTFDAFCRLRWDMSPQHAGRLMEAASVCRQLSATGDTPSSIRQANALGSLPPSQREEAWQEARAAKTPEGVIPAKAVHEAVEKRSRRARSRNSGTLKKLRLKVPGGVVIFEPNKRATDHLAMARHALALLDDSAKRAA